MRFSDTQAAVGLLEINAGIRSKPFTAYNASRYTNHVLWKLKEQFGSSNNVNNHIEHSDSHDKDEGSLDSFIKYDSNSSQGKCKDGMFSTGDDGPILENNSNHTFKLHPFEPI